MWRLRALWSSGVMATLIDQQKSHCQGKRAGRQLLKHRQVTRIPGKSKSKASRVRGPHPCKERKDGPPAWTRIRWQSQSFWRRERNAPASCLSSLCDEPFSQPVSLASLILAIKTAALKVPRFVCPHETGTSFKSNNYFEWKDDSS